MTNKLDISTGAFNILSDLLNKHLPNTEVWAYGSRVKGKARRASDLDLVAFTTPRQRPQVYDLKEAFEESILPFRVDLMIWDELPKSFQDEIKLNHLPIPIPIPLESPESRFK